MQFWKMNGAGNDFIILNNLQEGLSADCFPALARRLCERRLSIGADGLMVVERPQSGGDYRMLFYNSDGSAGEMCGNGARCICRYGYEIGLAGELQRVETTAGLVTGRRITRRQYKIELNRPTTLRLDYPVEVDGKTYPCSYVELGYPGLPHAVFRFRDCAAGRRRSCSPWGGSCGPTPPSPRAQMSISSMWRDRGGSGSAPLSGAWRASPTPAARAPARWPPC